MQASSIKEIYFHVGTGKTGTKFLQYRIFPKLKGICYIQRTRYKRAITIIQKKKFNKFLVSNEFDQQLEREVKSFSSVFPNAHPIIVFRRQESYIASQYKRFIKNGNTGSFTDFIDVENDTGVFKKQDLNYCRQIKILENCFHHKPFVLIFDELKKSPGSFVEKLVQHMGVSINADKINLREKHRAYSEHQLKAILFLGKYINMKKRRVFKNNILHFFWQRFFGTLRYSTLYIAKFLPRSIFSDTPLFENSELEKIQETFRDDWENCLKYAENQSNTQKQ